ncbi:amidohydrolase [[Mycoplasma] testudinis]|uniref:amidohydrolase n=1 Tax=[Mycoplasma] testudinis TaxID=33924 RepID=UPI000482DD65|nr:amidohydrolase [[Mycoplasma] testudinis]
MKTAYINGNVYLGNNRFAQAFIVENDKFIKTGLTSEIQKISVDKTIDLKKQTVIPGLNDSHIHFRMLALNSQNLDLTKIFSLKDLISQCRVWIKNHKITPKKNLWAEGFDETAFSDCKLYPTRKELDKISEFVPIYLSRIDRHMIVCNTAALKKMKVFIKNFQSQRGGILELGADGLPNGILKEGACGYARDEYLPPTLNEQLKIYQKTMKMLNSYGLTSVHCCDLTDEKIMEYWKVYELADKKNLITLKFYHQTWMSCPEKVDLFFDVYDQLKNSTQSEYNKIGHLKIFADGSIGAGTAALNQPYSDQKNNHGFLVYTNDKLDKVVKQATQRKIPIVCHALGDQAIAQILKIYEKYDKSKKNPLRHGIIHCLMTDDSLIKKIKNLNIVVYGQPCLYDNSMLFLKKRIGAKRFHDVLTFKRFLDSNIHLGFGTDAPVSDFNPWPNLYFAISRIDLPAQPKSGTVLHEKISLNQAIDAYTQGSAYASYEENVKGKIEMGFKADFVVLNQNIFALKKLSDLKNTKAIKTYLNGKLVYKY